MFVSGNLDEFGGNFAGFGLVRQSLGLRRSWFSVVRVIEVHRFSGTVRSCTPAATGRRRPMAPFQWGGQRPAAPIAAQRPRQ